MQIALWITALLVLVEQPVPARGLLSLTEIYSKRELQKKIGIVLGTVETWPTGAWFDHLNTEMKIVNQLTAHFAWELRSAWIKLCF